jgi:hypothetical protein
VRLSSFLGYSQERAILLYQASPLPEPLEGRASHTDALFIRCADQAA